MSHKFEINFDWLSIQRAHIKEHGSDETAYETHFIPALRAALDAEYPGFDVRAHITSVAANGFELTFSEAQKAMMFKLTHGGAA